MADLLDHITLAEAKAALNLNASVTTHDTELAQYITAVSERIDDLCGPVVARSVEETRRGGVTFIRPRKTPVLSVTSLVEYVSTTATTLTAETNDTKPADGYLIEEESTHNVRILRRSSGSDAWFPAGRQNIVLTYSAGRAANTAAVSAKFKEACALTVSHLWEGNSPAWAQTPEFADVTSGNNDSRSRRSSPVPGWAVPRAVVELLGHELLPPSVG